MNRWLSCFLILGLGACGSDPLDLAPLASRCPRDGSVAPDRVPACLLVERTVDSATARELANALTSVEASARRLHARGDSLHAIVLDSAIQRTANFFREGILDDSARVHRLVDHLLVSDQFASGELSPIGPRYYSPTTPHIAWHYYRWTGAGIFPHVLETMQALGSVTPDSLTAPTDSLAAAAGAIWRYAIWHQADGRRYPVWEYLFKNELADPTGSGYRHMLYPPWRSSMPQGDALRLFSILYARTRQPIWAERARAVLVSFDVPWHSGGVRLDDTTNGYWYEEALPEAMIWNGSMQALIDVGVYAKTFPDDSLGARLWRRGLDAAYRFTPDYDTGSWLRYSRVQGNVAAHYRNFCVALALALSRLTNDSTTWKGYARRWARYPIPDGRCVGGPCHDAPPPRIP